MEALSGFFPPFSLKSAPMVFTSGTFEDAEGNPQLEVFTTVTFAEHEGKTKLTLQAVVVKSAPEVAVALDGMEEGWSQSLDRLAEHLGIIERRNHDGR